MTRNTRRVSIGLWQAQGPGTRRESDGSRKSALRKSRRGPPLEPYDLTVDQSWKLAADNALEVEWLAAREDIKRLTQRSMTAAEVGVRLQAILARFPGLASASGCSGISPFNDEGAGRVSKELLPLPLPACTLVRERDYPNLFPADGVLGPKGIRSWAQGAGPKGLRAWAQGAVLLADWYNCRTKHNQKPTAHKLATSISERSW